jgi:hypothetical protein
MEKSTRPEIAYAVHQCTHFSACPKQSHAEAVKCIGRYLAGTGEKGIVIRPEENSLECYVDAFHAGEWKNN